MSKTLNLHRAARLVGVTRGALQQKIHDGELDAFDGLITLDELHRAFPDATLEDNTTLEHVEHIKDRAFGHRVMDRALPDKEVLAARVHELSRELVESKSLLNHARGMLEGFNDVLNDWVAQGGDRGRLAAQLKNWLHDQQMQMPPASAAAQALMIRDSFLRVIAAQVKITPSGLDFFVEGADTLLDAALRAGIALPYNCSNGSCGNCRAKVISGSVKQVRPVEYRLSQTLQDQGYALLCACTAISDLVLEVDVAQSPRDLSEVCLSAEVRAIERPTEEVSVLHIKTPGRDRLRFLAGQRAVVTLGGSLSHELPIASCPCEDQHLEFHVRRLRGNHFSDFAFQHLQVGDAVTIRGPRGDFILDTESPRPIVFVAFCTGFAPIKSLMEHAMALDQAESIHLLWIATKDTGLYFEGLARSWADALDNFSYKPVVVGGDLDATASRQEQVIEQMVLPALMSLPQIKRADIYIAGPSLAVGTLSKQLIRTGVAEASLHWDYEG